MKNIIVWEKWRDPFGFEDEDISEEDHSFSDEDESEYDDAALKKTTKIKTNIISTPFGMIPITETTDSCKIFNFWAGHTNFPITNQISEVIENCDGVETLNVFTKYRFRISVGKAFNDSEVLRQINESVYNFLKENHV